MNIMKKKILVVLFNTFIALSSCTFLKKECNHEVIIDESIMPTCTEHGLTEGSHCSICGEILKKQEIVEPTGHKIIIDDPIEATCTNDGHTSGAHCETCGATLVEITHVEHYGHTLVIDEYVAPECERNGLTEGSHCETCGEVVVAQEIIPALGHEYIFDDPVEPSCIQEGKTMGMHCNRCNKILISQSPIDMLSHKHGKLKSISLDKFEGINCPGVFECDDCHEEYIGSILKEDIDLPIVEIAGDLTEISKENKVQVSFSFNGSQQSFDCDAKIKWQGQSSLAHQKKNYSIQLYEKDTNCKTKKKVKLVESWGSQNKYCLKANYIDFSGIRNITSAKIYGEMVKSLNLNDPYTGLVNGGAVDGFPVILYENGQYHGLYTFNTPKDKWIFGMEGDETSREAILFARTGTSSIRLLEELNGNYDDGWEIEYCSTEDNNDIGVQWVTDSMNAAIRFLNSSSDEEFINDVGNYFNIERTIDGLIITALAQADDNRFHNILWSTFDGEKWCPTIYDFDGTWGLVYNGEGFTQIEDFVMDHQVNYLWTRLWTNFKPQIVQRYKFLRENVLSIQNIDAIFTDSINTIPQIVYDAEMSRWPLEPSQLENSITQIGNYLIEKFIYLDSRFGVSINDNNFFKVSFVKNENYDIYVWHSSNYNLKKDLADFSYARNSDTGYLDNSGSGQINFLIVPNVEYEVNEVMVDGSYKNIKGPSDTGIINCFRITKISSNLTVSVSLK